MTPNQIQYNDEGLPDWEPISLYDAPGTVITQILDGEGSLGLAAKTFMHQEQLSPTERNSYTQQLKKAAGGDKNPLIGSAIDIITNPFVLFMLATSPVTKRQFAKVGGIALSGNSELGKFSRMIVDKLRGLNLLGSVSMNEHAETSQAVLYMHNKVNEINAEMHKIVGPARGAMAKDLGKILQEEIYDFDDTRYRGDQKRVIGMLNKMMAISEAGLFSDDEGGRFLRAGMTRVAKVQDPAGNQRIEILPLASKKGEAVREFKAGSTFKRPGDDSIYTIVDEPIAINSLDNYKKAKSMLGRNFSHVTVEEFIPEGNNRLPITREQGMQVLTDLGFDPQKVKNYMEATRAQNKMLAGLNFTDAEGLAPALNPDGSLKISADRVINQVRSHAETSGVRKSLSQAELDTLPELLGNTSESLVPEWVVGAVREGHMSKTQVADVVRQLYGAQINEGGRYLPRNISNIWTKHENQGVRVEPYDTTVIGKGDSIKDHRNVSSFTQLRESDHLTLDPQDLEFVLQNTDHVLSPQQRELFQQHIQTSKNYINSKLRENEVAAVTPLDFERSIRTYTTKATANAIYHAMDLPPELANAAATVLKRKPQPLANEDVQSKMELEPLSRMRKRTLDMLGITDEDLSRIRLGDATFRPDLKFTKAARVLRDEIQNRQLQIQKAEMRPSARVIDSASGTSYLERLQRAQSTAERELGFIRDYRTPAVAVKEVPNMAGLMSAILPRENQETQEYMDQFLIPRLFGGGRADHSFGLGTMQAARKAIKKFANSGVGLYLRDNGGSLGKELHEWADGVGNKPLYMRDAIDLNRNMASWLYSTHLSSPLTAMYNGLQLFTWAGAEVGYPQVLKGLGTAWKRWSAYKAERLKYPVRIDPGLRREILLKTIPETNWNGHDLTGILDNHASSLDSAIFGTRIQGKPGFFKTYFMDAPLQLFKMFEEINRLGVATSGLEFYEKMMSESGVRLTKNQIATQIQNMQGRYNFASDPTSKPRILQDPNTPFGFMTNPLGGQLLQFGIRSVTNIATSAQSFGGKREFGLGKIGGPSIEIPAQVADLGRILGMSAIIYEIGKNAFNLDLSPGLGAQNAAGLGQSAMQGFVPPAAQIAIGITKGLVEGDKNELRRQLFRTMPFGIALSKALGALPPIPGGGPFGLLQSQYADWNNPNADGNIPVYRDDGTIQSFESPLSLVMRGVGFDPKKYKSPMEATKFLIANRAQMVDMRRQFKDATLGNNFAAATQIEAEYKKRFGVPMTVKPSEWDRAIALRETALSERMLDMMPSDVRDQYAQMLNQPGLNASMGITQGGLESGDTARQRASVRQFSSGLSSPTG